LVRESFYDLRPATRNHLRYQPKEAYGSSHWWAERAIVSRLLDKNAAILDIGSGSGVLGRLLQERGFTNVWAVEPDADARAATTQRYQEILPALADVSKAQNSKGTKVWPETFDAILILDVLEHLADPKAMYLHSLKLLKPNGIILISVPNILHWSVRLSVLFGLFEYTERGFLIAPTYISSHVNTS